MGDQRHAPTALPRGKRPRFPLYRRLGGSQVPVWTDAENLTPTGIRSPDRPARSESLYQVRYPDPRGWCTELFVRPVGTEQTVREVVVWLIVMEIYSWPVPVLPYLNYVECGKLRPCETATWKTTPLNCCEVAKKLRLPRIQRHEQNADTNKTADMSLSVDQPTDPYHVRRSFFCMVTAGPGDE